MTVNLGCGRPDSSQPDRRHDIFAKRVGVILFFLCILTIPFPQAKHNTHLKHELAKNKHSGVFFLFTPQNPARHERCDCCGTRHSAPGPPKMRPSRFIATLYYYSLFFFSILFNFINSQLFYTKLVLIFYRKCVIMLCLKVFIRSPQQRHKLLRFTPVGRKKNDHPPCGSYNRSEISGIAAPGLWSDRWQNGR